MGRAQQSSLIEPYGILIDGAETDAAGGDSTTVENPSTGEALSEVPAGTVSDLERAVAAAREAFEAWSRIDPAERSRLLNTVGGRIREEADRLARVETLEHGRPLSDAHGQVTRCARHFEYYAGIADKIQGDQIPLGEGHVDYTIREPVGVTGHIVPWNVPIYLFGRSVAPALAAGNTAVVKPANLTPLGAIEVGRIVDDVLPDGVLNVVPGAGSVVGDALSAHDDVGSITFTGSGETGVAVGRNAASAVTDVVLELGGKSPFAVYPDTNIGEAAAEVIRAIFTGSGQICSAGSRALVHESIHEAFMDELRSRIDDLEIGPGVEDPDMGPLISASHRRSVLEYVDLGRETIGDPAVGGELIDGDGFFMEPTVFDEVPNDSRIAQEEIFGPVLTVTTFADESEAIDLANDVEYGLAAGVMTDDLRKAHRFAREVDAGQIYINEWFAGGNETPFGGFKKSGVGRDNGIQAIDNYTQIKNVCADIGFRDGTDGQ